MPKLRVSYSDGFLLGLVLTEEGLVLLALTKEVLAPNLEGTQERGGLTV